VSIGKACEFKDADARWLQRALDGWELVRRNFLKIDAHPLPWIVLYDAACVWELAATGPALVPDAKNLETSLTLAGAPLQVRAAPHGGTVLLPNRVEIPIEVKASTALYRDGRAPFLVMSMPSIWRSARRHATKPFLDYYLQGVFTHELTHTIQLVRINRHLRRLLRMSDVPGRLTDDVIQARFNKERGFARAVEAERDLFYRAVQAVNPVNRRDLVEKALGMVKQRHARYFTDANAAYVEIEGLFLTMEGAAQWAAYSLTRTRDSRGLGDLAAMKLVRDDRRYWSQDQGLALFILLDGMVPNWQSRMFAPLPPSPFTLLEEALGKGSGAEPRSNYEPILEDVIVTSASFHARLKRSSTRAASSVLPCALSASVRPESDQPLFGFFFKSSQ
jgi:hypothetical protein